MLVEHQAEWAGCASRLLSGVRDAIDGLDRGEAAALDHIGSTSVPGLAPTNPFVDLQLRISPLPSEAELITRLTPLGYVRARGSRPDSPGVDRDLPRGSINVDSVVWEKVVQQIGKADYGDYTLAKTEFFDQVQSDFEEWAARNH